MNRQKNQYESKINRQLEALLNHEFISIQKQIEELIQQIKGSRVLDLDKEVEIFESYLEAIKSDDRIIDSKNIFRTITYIGNIETEIEIIEDTINVLSVSNISSQTKSTMQKLSQSIKGLLKKVSKRLWQFLSQMMNLNEWSISGNIGANICGFSGGASLQLTFAP